MLYCFIGPSGTGKSTLVKSLQDKFSLKEVESYTTRPPRFEGERGHIFISKKKFDKLDLIAYTNFNNYEYGVTKDMLDKNDLYIVDLDGLMCLKEKYDRPITVIGLYASPFTLRNRMIERGDSREAAQERIDHDKKKFGDYLDYCDIILDANRDKKSVFEQCCRELELC